MDVRAQQSGKERPTGSGRRPLMRVSGPRAGYGVDWEWVGQVLGEWQAQEVRAARNYPECRGLSTEQLEDIYQETTVALLRRPYLTEEHLRNALRMGVKHRALNLHRDERRRGQILAQSAPGMYVMAEEREDENAPELAALVHQDRLIVSEFLTELNEVEQRVFGGLVEGLQYRAIASAEGIEVNVARNASRSCERKRERFQLLYDTGRLCGFRSATIQALQSGEATSKELAERAFAHLEGCASCRAEHKTNARRLRRSFQSEAAALLPPFLAGPLGWSTRARMLLHRFMPDMPAGSGGVRERATALLAGGGAAAKIATGAATVAVIAGGTIATHVFDHEPSVRADYLDTRPEGPARQTLTTAILPAFAPAAGQALLPVPRRASRAERRHKGNSTPRRVLASVRRKSPSQSSESVGPREPGGFAYLGVPASSTTSPSASVRALEAHTESQRGGGPFSP